MLIIALLFGLGGIIFLGWLFGFFPPPLPEPKYRSQDFKPDQLPAKSTKASSISPQNFVPLSPVPTQKAILAKNFKKQLPLSKATKRRVRLAKKLKKQANIQYASQVLQRLRSKTPIVKLPVVIATLRRISPYVFEELVLTCCFEQGWQIQRNFRYTGDGGIDGRVLILGKLYVIQVKRYADYISPKHIKDFLCCIEGEGASGGFFVHTGITGQLSKQLIRRSDKIILVSGQKLVNFVLGKQFKIVGITIPVKTVNSYQ